VLAEPVRARDLGARGRAAVVERFGVERMADEVASAFAEAQRRFAGPHATA
jgi:hypothetical protein